MSLIVRSFDTAERTPQLVAELVALWRRSVSATHHFLDATAIQAIEPEVAGGLSAVPTLVVEYDDHRAPVGFIGVAGDTIEMLFVDPDHIGTGVGGRLIRHAIADLGARRVDVNEQNPNAREFYEHLGFAVVDRSDVDDHDRPYPILHMSLTA